MNFNIYLRDELAKKLAYLAEVQQKSRNSLISEAIEAFLNNNKETSVWPKLIIEFKGLGESFTPFEAYRAELPQANEKDLF